MPEEQYPQDSAGNGSGEPASPWSSPPDSGAASGSAPYPPPPAPSYSQAPPPLPYGQQGQQSAQQPAPHGQQPYGQQTYGQQPYGQQPYAGAPTSSGATLVLVCGILSLFVGFIPAIIALVKAPSAKREILASNGQLSGLGLITAGKIMSWISIAMSILVLLVIIGLVVVAMTTTTTTGGTFSTTGA